MTDTRHTLDLTRFHYKRAHGDVTVYATWFLFGEGEGWRPVLALLPTDEGAVERGARPYVVPMNNTWVFTEDGLGDPLQAARSCAIAAVCMGFEPLPVRCMGILSIIREHLGTLLTIPPKPPFNPERVVADVIQRFEDGRVEEHGVVDDI